MTSDIDHRTIVQDAMDIYRRSASFDQEQLDRAIDILSSHGVWSMRQMEKLLGVPPRLIRPRVAKTNKTGGQFNPDTLDYVLEEIMLAEIGESNPRLTAKIWDMGTSPNFLSKLIGQPVSTIRVRGERGRQMAAEDG